MRKSVLRLAGWRAASWAETAAIARVAGAMAKREVAKARGRAAAAGEGAVAGLTEATQCSAFLSAIERECDQAGTFANTAPASPGLQPSFVS